MRALALLVVAGCGRIAFDPLGGGGPNGDGDGGTNSGDGGGGSGDGGTTTGDGGTTDASMVTCNSSYVSGGNTFVNGTTATASISAPANNMANTLIVVQIHWAANTGTVSGVTDTTGNTYSAATTTARQGTFSQVLYTAPYAIGSSGTVTVMFAAPVPNPDITTATYSGVNLSNLFAATAQVGTGNSTAPVTSVANVSATATLVAALTSASSSASAGTGFQERASNSGSHVQDGCASAGLHNASASLSTSSNWILHMISLRSL